ncbi:MAG: hypothetical protein MdMp014T_1135 [Treponematales bacterium]
MTDTVLKHEGLKVLNDRLGPVEMERFLALISREQGDYTEWHKAQEDAPSVHEYSKRAMDYQREMRERRGE